MSARSVKQYLELMQLSGVDTVKITNCSGDSGEADISQDNEHKAELTMNQPEQNMTAVNTNAINHLEELKKKYQNCQKCSLCKQRNSFVYGEGSQEAKLLLIGEGPGAEEDKQGKPFIGRAGQLLTKMLAAIQLERDEVYITNVVKCRPPGNRNPLPDEVAMCLPYLKEQIGIIKPKIILLLGKVAAESLLQVTEPMFELRKKKFDIEGIMTYVSYHPAALIYNQSLKKESWIDLQKIQKIYNS
jgi:uracil-DNA glycosylase